MTDIELTDGDILIRPFKLEYAEDQLLGDDEENIKWLSGSVSTIEDVRNWILKNQKSWENDGPIFNFAIFDKKTNQQVGMVEANSTPDAVHGLQVGEVNVSYSIYPKARGKGYATKAVNLILNFLKEKGFSTAVIHVDPENKKSLGIPERTGFTKTELITTKDGDKELVFVKRLQNSPLTLSEMADKPNRFTYSLDLSSGEEVRLRPLLTTDVQLLTDFLEGLSVETRRLSTFPSYDVVTSQEFCDAIAKYDKLRFVVESGESKIVGLLEFSFGLPDDDLQRYEGYGVPLNSLTDCRFGPTLADEYQDKGLGSAALPHIIDTAKNFGKERVILYGGVLADNPRAIHFYEKHGFTKVGSFINSDNKATVDMILSNLNLLE